MPRPNLVFHPADDQRRYPWWSWIPARLRQLVTIWIGALHGNIATDDLDAMAEQTQAIIESQRLLDLAEHHNLVLLAPVIPRFDLAPPESGYAIVLPRNIFDGQTLALCQRPDLEVVSIIDHCIAELESRGHRVDHRVLLEGFSAGSMFAQRFTLVHPERVMAVAIGQAGGALTLPDPHYADEPLPWPRGIADLEALVGAPFNRATFLTVPHRVYIGGDDVAHSTISLPGELWPDQRDIDWLNETFGDADPTRLARQVRYLQDRGYTNMTFQRYPGVGHDPRPMLDDTLMFLSRSRSVTSPHKNRV